MNAPYFTEWRRSMDDGSLVLTTSVEGRIVEVVEIDVSELPSRPDLLGRLGPVARMRLLDDALASVGRA